MPGRGGGAMGPGGLTTPRIPGKLSRRACIAAGGYGWCVGAGPPNGNGVPGPTAAPGGAFAGFGVGGGGVLGGAGGWRGKNAR